MVLALVVTRGDGVVGYLMVRDSGGGHTIPETLCNQHTLFQVDLRSQDLAGPAAA